MSFDEDPNIEPTAECQQCGTIKQLSDPCLKNWEMQHLHFNNCDIKFLTCESCKTKSPSEFAKKAIKNIVNRLNK